MLLKQQVSCLECSKKLKELGVKQESLFYWDFCRFTNGDEWIIRVEGYDYSMPTPIESVSAFTVAELGEILKQTNCSISSNYISGNEEWLCDMSNWPLSVGETEACARAKMLIYLIENKLIVA